MVAAGFVPAARHRRMVRTENGERIMMSAQPPAAFVGRNLADLDAAAVAALPWPMGVDDMEPSLERLSQAAGRAAQAVACHSRLTGWGDKISVESAITDLLGDLAHLADALDLTMHDLAQRAQEDYESQRDGS